MAAFLNLVLLLLVATTVADYVLIRLGVQERIALAIGAIFGLLCVFFIR